MFKQGNLRKIELNNYLQRYGQHTGKPQGKVQNVGLRTINCLCHLQSRKHAEGAAIRIWSRQILWRGSLTFQACSQLQATTGKEQEAKHPISLSSSFSDLWAVFSIVVLVSTFRSQKTRNLTDKMSLRSASRSTEQRMWAVGQRRDTQHNL